MHERPETLSAPQQQFMEEYNTRWFFGGRQSGKSTIAALAIEEALEAGHDVTAVGPTQRMTLQLRDYVVDITFRENLVRSTRTALEHESGAVVEFQSASGPFDVSNGHYVSRRFVVDEVQQLPLETISAISSPASNGTPYALCGSSSPHYDDVHKMAQQSRYGWVQAPTITNPGVKPDRVRKMIENLDGEVPYPLDDPYGEEQL